MTGRFEKRSLGTGDGQIWDRPGGSSGGGHTEESMMYLRAHLCWLEVRERAHHGGESPDQAQGRPDSAHSTHSGSLGSSRPIPAEISIPAARCCSLSETARA